MSGPIYTTLTRYAQPISGAPYFSEKSLKKVLFYRQKPYRLPLRRLPDDGLSLLTTSLKFIVLYCPRVVAHWFSFASPLSLVDILCLAGGLALHIASRERRIHLLSRLVEKTGLRTLFLSLFNLAFFGRSSAKNLLRSLFIR